MAWNRASRSCWRRCIHPFRIIGQHRRFLGLRLDAARALARMVLPPATARALFRHRRSATGNSAERLACADASHEVCLPFSAGRVARCLKQPAPGPSPLRRWLMPPRFPRHEFGTLVPAVFRCQSRIEQGRHLATGSSSQRARLILVNQRRLSAARVRRVRSLGQRHSMTRMQMAQVPGITDPASFGSSSGPGHAPWFS